MLLRIVRQAGSQRNQHQSAAQPRNSTECSAGRSHRQSAKPSPSLPREYALWGRRYISSRSQAANRRRSLARLRRLREGELGRQTPFGAIDLCREQIKQLAKLAQVCSVALDVRQANEFGKAIADLQQPGESLYDTSRKVGRLLCEGASLKDVLERRLPIQREVSTAGPAPKSRTAEANGPPSKWKSKTSFQEPPPPLQRGITLEDDKTLSQIAVKEGKYIVAEIRIGRAPAG